MKNPIGDQLWEAANDCNDFLPESRYGGIVFCSLFEKTYLGLEYLYPEFDNEDKSQVDNQITN